MRRPHGGALCCHNNAPRTPPTTHPVILSLDGTDDTTPFNQPPPTIPTTTTPFTLPENWEFREQATFRRFVSLFIRFMEDAAGFAVMHLFLMCFVITSNIFLK